MGETPATGGGFAAAFKAVMEKSSWTLSALADELTTRGTPVTAATLSYWQTGARRPGRQKSADIVRAMEDVLEVESGSLLAHVTGARVRGRSARFKALKASDEAYAVRMGQMLHALGMKDNAPHTLLFLHEVLTFDETAARVSDRVIQVLRAESEPTRRVYLGMVDSELVDGPATVTDLTLGEVSGYMTDREMGIMALRLDLPATFEVGEIFMMDYVMQYPHAVGPAHVHQRWFTRAVREHAVTLRFHPDKEPVEARGYITAEMELEGNYRTAREVPVCDSTVQVVNLDLAPGTVGLRVRFADEKWESQRSGGPDELREKVAEAWQTWDGDAAYGPVGVEPPPREL